METWSRRPLANAELIALRLTPEEGFVLSRLETPLSAPEVIALTGFRKAEVERILGTLVSKGAILSSEPTEGPFDELIDLGPATVPPPEPAALQPPVPEEPASENVPEETQEAKNDESNYRKIFETELRTLTREQRLEIAKTATGRRLLAICFDLDPVVIRAVVSNREYGLTQARIASRHHPNSGGLEAIAQRSDVLSDGQVQRNLLRNPQVSEALAKRILMPKRMVDSYKTSLDTDVPERARQFARAVLRTKFAISQGEEKAGIINSTEGRVLTCLAGLTLDARATQILCSRSYASLLFIQNLARFGACPPPLLAHLLKQPIVRRQQHLKNLLLQHPNMPSEAKKRI